MTIETEWREYEPLPFSTTKLIDGTTHSGAGLLMRRLAPDHTWQYRLPTAEEEQQNWAQSFF